LPKNFPCHCGDISTGEMLYFLFGSMSITLSCIVVFLLLYQIGVKSALSRLVLYLQVSILLEQVSSYPSIYVYPAQFCNAMAALKQYFTMVNLCANALFALYTSIMIFSASHRRNQLSKPAQAVTFLFPLVAILPLTTGSYGQINNMWCTFEGSAKGSKWNIGLSMMCFIINMVAIAINVSVITRLMKTDPGNYKTVLKVVRGSSLYCFVTVGCWIPKIFTFDLGSVQTEDVGIQFSRSFTFVAGLCYFLIFLVERDSMVLFENYVTDNPKNSIGSSVEEDVSDFSSTPHQSVDSVARGFEISKELSVASVISPIQSGFPSLSSTHSAPVNGQLGLPD
jgi:hypothetical protein